MPYLIISAAPWRPIALGVLLSAAIASNAAATGSTRPLYVFSPSANDTRLARQQEINRAAASGFRDRDMTVTVVTKPGALRRRFGVGTGQFRVILVGKDGGVKLSSDAPVPAATLFSLIDSMPMRRDEIRQRGR